MTIYIALKNRERFFGQCCQQNLIIQANLLTTLTQITEFPTYRVEIYRKVALENGKCFFSQMLQPEASIYFRNEPEQEH